MNQACDVKPVYPLTAKEKDKYGVPKDIMILTELAQATEGLDEAGINF